MKSERRAGKLSANRTRLFSLPLWPAATHRFFSSRRLCDGFTKSASLLPNSGTLVVGCSILRCQAELKAHFRCQSILEMQRGGGKREVKRLNSREINIPVSWSSKLWLFLSLLPRISLIRPLCPACRLPPSSRLFSSFLPVTYPLFYPPTVKKEKSRPRTFLVPLL